MPASSPFKLRAFVCFYFVGTSLPLWNFIAMGSSALRFGWPSLSLYLPACLPTADLSSVLSPRERESFFLASKRLSPPSLCLYLCGAFVCSFLGMLKWRSFSRFSVFCMRWRVQKRMGTEAEGLKSAMREGLSHHSQRLLNMFFLCIANQSQLLACLWGFTSHPMYQNLKGTRASIRIKQSNWTTARALSCISSTFVTEPKNHWWFPHMSSLHNSKDQILYCQKVPADLPCLDDRSGLPRCIKTKMFPQLQSKEIAEWQRSQGHEKSAAACHCHKRQ